MRSIGAFFFPVEKLQHGPCQNSKLKYIKPFQSQPSPSPSQRGRVEMASTTTTRRWWKRRRQEEEEDEDDLHPMDTQEQEELVGSLEQKQAHQSCLWRRVFAGFLLGYAAFLVYSSFHHAFSPWQLRYHAYFMEDMLPSMVIIADWIAALACLLAAKGLLNTSSSSKKWMWYACYTSLLVAIFWTYYILRLPRFRWDIIWLPFGPLTGAATSLYVDHLLLASMQDISTLRSYMYNYKAL